MGYIQTSLCDAASHCCGKELTIVALFKFDDDFASSFLWVTAATTKNPFRWMFSLHAKYRHGHPYKCRVHMQNRDDRI